MELRQLRYFAVVVELLSFPAAGRRLGVAQSAISHQIQALENELGVELLDRSRARIALTCAGGIFHRAARQVLGETDFAVARVRKLRGGRARKQCERQLRAGRNSGMTTCAVGYIGKT